MLHPSYNELMKAVNENAGGTEENPVVSSRYSIVIAAAKRARQLITEENKANEAEDEAGRESRPEKIGKAEKPLSVAIRELMDGDVKIIPNEDDMDDDSDLMYSSDPMSNIIYTTDEDEESEENEEEDSEYDSDLDDDLDDDDDDLDDDDDDDDDSMKLSEDELD